MSRKKRTPASGVHGGKREQPQKTYGPQQRFGSGAGGGKPHKSAEHLAGKSRKVH